MALTFEKIELIEPLVKGLGKAGIKEPTEIQEKVIPTALQGKDLIAQSETGTGKTLAYLLPLFQRVDTDKREMQFMILAPTHELVMQINKEIELLAKNSELNVTSAAIIGNANITRQVERLKEKPHIIVGSPVRVLELIKMKKISAHTIKTIVIDEADKMLDFNNIDNVKAVIKTTLRDRQLMLFSATISDKTITSARDFMKEPEIIKVEEKATVNPDIIHYVFYCEKRDKIEVLRKLFHAEKPEKAIVFINKSDEIEITSAKLNYHKINASGIHGTNKKEERKRALEDFRSGKVQLLVASDVAARGLDIKGVTHIFNLDLPEEPKDYLHRAGRTGRAGEKGFVMTIASEREASFIKEYEKSFDIKILVKSIYKGKIMDV